MAHESEELVIGLVGPVGCNLAGVERELDVTLEAAAYEIRHHRLSTIFESLSDVLPRVDDSSEYMRLKTAMSVGDELRRRTDQPGIMAILAAHLIARDRQDSGGVAGQRRAHVVRSLKRKEEVEYLRRLYGPRFVLISVFATRGQRAAELRLKGMSDEQATELIRLDEGGMTRHGQATSETFELADLFVDGGAGELQQQLTRFLDLLLGCPHHTPSMNEHAMFLAFAASLRSGDLSRQVGAVVLANDGTVVAEGCNDAPRFGGGPQWPDAHDTRDLRRGHDANERVKRQMVNKLLDGVGADIRQQLRANIEEAGVLDITEYGRAVHAEMNALTTCARVGVSTRGKLLFCTTFPCHNCAKHIVACGIEEVVFIEPYPKSRALDLHEDSVSIQAVADKVLLRPFVGVGPRRYVDLFALRDPYGSRVKRKDAAGDRAAWSSRTAAPAVYDRLVTYVELEQQASIELIEAFGELRAQQGS
jgi:deoxycytidylate deaminase